jgi:type 1 glutamine amidotransferase
MERPQALLLAGDRSHDPAIAFTGVGDLLEDKGIEVERTTDYASLDSHALTGKNLLIISRDGMEWPDGQRVVWMQPHQEQAIEAFVLAGGAFLALHNAGWAYPYEDGYRRTLGGYYIGHPPVARFRVEVINDEHPVTAGVESYEIVDEQHWLHWDFDRVTPLLISKGMGEDGRQSVSGWAYTYGRGRVVYLPHGHTLEAQRHPMNQRLLRNATRWLLSIEQ